MRPDFPQSPMRILHGGALFAALAALCAVLVAGVATAPAQDLQSKLDAKQAKLVEGRRSAGAC